MAEKTPEELETEASNLAKKAEIIVEKIEEKNTWTPEQITKLMTQLSEIQAQQAAILAKLETQEKLPSTQSTPPVLSVEEVDPLEAEQEAEKQRLVLEKEQQAKQSAPLKKHRMM